MKRRNVQGITLIALIITTTIMLILAGVVISLTLGENGLFKTAKYAVNKWNNSTEQEQADLEELYVTLENMEEIKNYEMLYDGNAKTEEEKEAIEITGGWVDVTKNNTSAYGSMTGKLTKNEKSINFYSQNRNNSAPMPSISINNDISNIDYYKLYTSFTGNASTVSYSGYSMAVTYLNVNPVRNKFSIYGSNDNRINITDNSSFYQGTSYSNKIQSTYKPRDNGYICIYLSCYKNTSSLYTYSADMKNCWIVKQDDYNKLAKIAKLEGEYDIVEKILTKEALTKICGSEVASEYMVKRCTGDLMCELLGNDEALQYITPQVKKKMKENENWSKFIEIYERQEIFN